MEVTLSACVVAWGYTLRLLMASPVGSSCLAQQVPNLAMGNSTQERYSCRWLPSKGLVLKGNTLGSKLTVSVIAFEEKHQACVCTALRPGWQHASCLVWRDIPGSGATQPGMADAFLMQGCTQRDARSSSPHLAHPSKRPPHVADTAAPGLPRQDPAVAGNEKRDLSSLRARAWGAGYPEPLTSSRAEAQLLPPPSQAFPPACNIAGVITKTQLHRSSPAQTSNYSHLRGLHLQLCHVGCDS